MKNKCAISDKHKFSSLTVFYLSFSDCLIYSSPIALLSLFRKAVTPKEPYSSAASSIAFRSFSY